MKLSNAGELKPYPEMKNSGIEWLGEVPKHWTVERLKASVANIVEQNTERKQRDIYLALEHVESWTGRIKSADLEVPSDSQLKRFESEDVLFGKLRPYLAKVTRPGNSGLCVGEFLVLRPRNPKFSSGYAEQLLRSKPVIDVVDSSTSGAKMPRADWTFIGSMAVVRPSLPEQTAIVRFLDHADRRIRRYIRAKQKLIALLEERKLAIIHQAVTGKIDVRTGKPYPSYKDSGVEWLGEVPKHWEVTALGHRYSQCLGKMLDSKRITGSHLLSYLRNTDVQWDRINIENLPTMDIFPREYDRYTVQHGDLLVCEGGEVGRCALWTDQLAICGFQKALHRLRPRNAEQDVSRFMYYVLRAAAKGHAFTDGHLSTIAHLTGDKLRTHRFPFPPIPAQNRIVQYLDRTTGDIEMNANRVGHQIELSREYRTRLIADVVTGKLDVREAAAELPDEDAPDDTEEAVLNHEAEHLKAPVQP